MKHRNGTRYLAAFALFTALACAGALAADVGVSMSFSASDDGAVLRHLSLSYFHADDSRAGVLSRAKDGPEHWGVYLWLARESGRDVNSIMRLRLEGLSWSVIFGRVGVDVGRVFVALPRPPGPPYGKAYGYWAHSPGKGGKGHGGPPGKAGDGAVALTDVEICDWINAPILAASLGLDVQVVLDRRSAGEPLVGIAGKAYREKHPHAAKPKDKEKEKPHGGGKGKGRH